MSPGLPEKDGGGGSIHGTGISPLKGIGVTKSSKI